MDSDRRILSHFNTFTIICVCVIIPSSPVPLGSSKINLNSFAALKSPTLMTEPRQKLSNNRIVENINLNYLLRRQVVQNRTGSDRFQTVVGSHPIRHSSRNRIKGVLVVNSKLVNVSRPTIKLTAEVNRAIDRFRQIFGANVNQLGMSDAKLFSQLQDRILTVLQDLPTLKSQGRRPTLADKNRKLFRLRRSADESEETSANRRKRFSGYKMFLDKTDKTSMLCPYTIEKDINANRFPKVINRIKCKFENCLCSNKGSFRCTQLWTKYEVQFKGATGTDEVDVEHSCVCATSQSLSANDIELPAGIVS